MSTPEQVVTSEVLARIGARPDVRLWRQNSGTAYVPTSDAGRAALQQLARHGGVRPVQMSVPGASDYVGLHGPDGRMIALELKSAGGRLSAQQTRFGQMVQSLGGIWIIARSADEAEAALATT